MRQFVRCMGANILIVTRYNAAPQQPDRGFKETRLSLCLPD